MEAFMALLPTILALMATGVFAGILAGLLGVGGGIVIVPVLYFLFQALGVSARLSHVDCHGYLTGNNHSYVGKFNPRAP